MKNRPVRLMFTAVLVPAVLAWSAACSRRPETPTAGSPTPAPTPAVHAIYVADGSDGKVLAYDLTGAPLAGFTAPTGFSDALGVAFNPANQTVYVSDRDKNVIRTFNAFTGAETQIGFAKAVGLDKPQGMVLVGGNLLVANYGGDKVLAFDAATGSPATAGFTAPVGLSGPGALAVRGTTLYIACDKVGAYDLATGKPLAGFTPVSVEARFGMALYGNTLFVGDPNTNVVGAYDATTGAELNAKFISDMKYPNGLAILGNRLLVENTPQYVGLVGAYGLPAEPKKGDVSTSSAPNFLAGAERGRMLVVVP